MAKGEMAEMTPAASPSIQTALLVEDVTQVTEVTPLKVQIWKFTIMVILKQADLECVELLTVYLVKMDTLPISQVEKTFFISTMAGPLMVQ
ncbi:MAG TPA: hypothetical protein DCR64_15200 [Vibrio sp.]|nr:hypothetical protein [Vibrio sp.]